MNNTEIIDQTLRTKHKMVLVTKEVSGGRVGVGRKRYGMDFGNTCVGKVTQMVG